MAYDAYLGQLNRYPVGVAMVRRAALAYSVSSTPAGQGVLIGIVPLLWGRKRGTFGAPPFPHRTAIT